MCTESKRKRKKWDYHNISSNNIIRHYYHYNFYTIEFAEICTERHHTEYHIVIVFIRIVYVNRIVQRALCLDMCIILTHQTVWTAYQIVEHRFRLSDPVFTFKQTQTRKKKKKGG